ncbi:MAG: hypothetical protein COB67_08240 [SAR324 cluster bacterium]|uniref:CBS domain-containing protein n=1 Tax=SAR324 cluster bacterium TaxID=2024889 RepID=A0A2A4T2L3_9DELT|nr:MAG: hypothetical protein COB67_08240 [SAR324 cluster bacterium]
MLNPYFALMGKDSIKSNKGKTLEVPSSSSFFSFFKDSLTADFPPPKDNQEEVELINNLEAYFNTTIREVMVPRTKMITLEQNQSLSEAIDVFRQTGYSRIPVKDKKVDNIVGIVRGVDLFDYFHAVPDIPVSEIMRKPYFASYSQPIHHLLNHFKQQRLEMAIVVDEYGGVDGLVTLTDIIGELIGDLPDEFNRAPNYEQIEDHLIIMDANFPLDDFNKLYNTDFFKEGIETIGGFICHSCGKILQKGENFKIGNIQFSVEDSNVRRLLKLRLIAPNQV